VSAVLDTSLAFWLTVWLLTAAGIAVRHWYVGRGTGLVLTYVLSFGAIYWLAASMYVLPWYLPPDFDMTVNGLRVAAIAMLAFGLGGEIGMAIFRRLGPASSPARSSATDPRVANAALAVGIVFYAVISPIVSRLPTAEALASTTSSLMVLGVALKAWNAWQRGSTTRTWLWLVSTLMAPFATVVGQGFLGFGFAAMVIVAAFVASFYRPRWQVVVVGLLVAYGGLSIYVTYMRDRRDIRQVVWGGQALGSRVDQLVATVTDFEWFDPQNIDHVHRVDERLNQDAFVGMAVDSIQSGAVPLAHGGTIRDAALALIPRAIWPDKPIRAGSGDLVSIYTGLTFAQDTSVGIGHVMECYVNFAMPGVVLGFMLIGAVVVYVDRSARAWLDRGDAGRFAIWYLPGLSLLLVGGSFVEMTSSAAAALVIAFAFTSVTKRFRAGAGARSTVADVLR
jgi:hypothetical protein